MKIFTLVFAALTASGFAATAAQQKAVIDGITQSIKRTFTSCSFTYPANGATSSGSNCGSVYKVGLDGSGNVVYLFGGVPCLCLRVHCVCGCDRKLCEHHSRNAVQSH